MTTKQKIQRFDEKYKASGGYRGLKVLLASGETLTYIGSVFGVSRQAVTQWIENGSLPIRKQKRNIGRRDDMQNQVEIVREVYREMFDQGAITWAPLSKNQGFLSELAARKIAMPAAESIGGVIGCLFSMGTLPSAANALMKRLNDRGIRNEYGRKWTRESVHSWIHNRPNLHDIPKNDWDGMFAAMCESIDRETREEKAKRLPRREREGLQARNDDDACAERGILFIRRAMKEFMAAEQKKLREEIQRLKTVVREERKGKMEARDELRKITDTVPLLVIPFSSRENELFFRNGFVEYIAGEVPGLIQSVRIEKVDN